MARNITGASPGERGAGAGGSPGGEGLSGTLGRLGFRLGPQAGVDLVFLDAERDSELL